MGKERMREIRRKEQGNEIRSVKRTREHAISGEIVRVCLFASVAGG